MSGFNFTKNERINWLLKTTSFSNLASGYIQSAGIQNIQISGFFVAIRRCVNLDPDPNPNRDPLIDPPYINLP